jgi:hypothetical protein
MPEKKTASDRFLAELEPLLELSGRERRRALAAARRRLVALAAKERRKGANAAEAEKRALASLGPAPRVAAELHEQALAGHARREAQIVLCAIVPIALAMVAVAFEVVGIKRIRTDTGLDIPSGNFSRRFEDFYHLHSTLDLWLPPAYLTYKLVLGGALILVVLVVCEVAIALARHRRASAALTLAAAIALVGVVSFQIAFAFEWNRLRQGHGAWLFAATMVEIGTLLLISPFLARPARVLLRGRPAPLASAPMLALLVLAPLVAVTSKSGLSSTAICPVDRYYNFCPTPIERVTADSANREVNVSLPPGPAGTGGAVALSGRRLAFAGTVWKKQSTGYGPSAGPVELQVWEARWSLAQRGPCGRGPYWGYDNPLAPTTILACGVGESWVYEGQPARYAVSWQRRARFPAGARALALGYRAGGRLVVAFSRAGAVYGAEAPSWKPRRLPGLSASAVRLSSTADGSLVLAAIEPAADGSRLVLMRERGGAWTKLDELAIGSGKTLWMVSRGAQTALLYRDRDGRLRLELRDRDLTVVAGRTFASGASAALGALRGDAIGLAVAEGRGRATELGLFRLAGGEIRLSSRERLRLPVGLRGARQRLVGVIQTGEVERALYGPGEVYHPQTRMTSSFWLSGEIEDFQADWPRWAVVSSQSEEIWDSGKRTRWHRFDVTIGQPPERQLERS